MIEKIDLFPEKNSSLSNCVIANNFIFTSTIGEQDAGSFSEALKKSFIELKEELKAAGATFDDVVKITLYLKKKEDKYKINEIFNKYFKKGYPARAILIMDFLEENILVKMDAIAYTGSE